MLQIIGLHGCLYLLVKGLEIIGTAPRNENGRPHGAALAAVALSILGSALFAFWLIAPGDGGSLPEPAPTSYPAEKTGVSQEAYRACMRDARTMAEMNDCTPD